ncbi:MAG: Deoxynucleoside kinase family protein [Nitrospirae bacterium]|jgi:deoxyadenosine/deoxycytidine kinase|nr:Deoxynucleoside kinase family protein [Nitrospirota bacterium]
MQREVRDAMNQNSEIRHARYIVIDGPIGVGKTSLATLLAPELNARLIFERAEENPFLTDFYHDPARFRFQTQIFFLMSRFAQQEEFSQHDLFNQVTISDYLFAKDRIFAYLNLNDHELALYEQIYKMIEPKVVRPDLVIYLQADTETILRRIKQRARPFEKDVSRDYIEAVNDAYSHFFFRYAETPLLVINTSDIDFVHNPQDLDDLIREILSMRPGTLYYVPRSQG